MTISKFSTPAFITTDDFSINLEAMIGWIHQIPSGLMAFPEVALTGFCYDRMAQAAAFGEEALVTLCKALNDEQMIALTMITADGATFRNEAFLITSQGIVFRQAKAKLFLLGKEDRYFAQGSDEAIRWHEIGDLRIGMLVCFELRFIGLWQQLKGADVVVVPAMWGKERKDHYVTLCRALALTLQCYVVAASSENHDMAGQSCVIDPWGEEIIAHGSNIAMKPFDRILMATIRRQLPL